MTEPVTLDDWLANIYASDNQRDKTPRMTAFKAALVGNSALMADAVARLGTLNDMIAVRGPQACAFSTKYQGYLSEALS